MDVILLQADGGKTIKGESQIDGYSEWVQLLSLSQGFSMQITTDVSNTARTSGKPNIQDLACVKYMDASSTKLYQACLQGSSIGTTKIVLARNGGALDGFQLQKIMEIQLTNPLISSMSMQANPGDMPTETFTINFSAISWTYYTQTIDTATNTAQTAFEWNLATNKNAA